MRAKTKIDIHKLVHWALVREHAEHVARLQAQAFSPGQSQGYATNNSVLELGTHVDSSTFAAKVAGAKCHDDALTVLDAIHRLPSEAQMVVIKCGRADCHPYFAPEGVGKMVPVLDRNGHPKKKWRNPETKAGFLGVEMVWEGLLREEVNFYRNGYKMWREALCELHASLQKELISYALTKKLPSTTPWKTRGKSMSSDGALKKVS
ncbi:hypothetical protein [Maritalea sp.]|uniref:hypothetical protein n=1 Tax=Maritalea sp. TaxID=2003361 RepID=UPI003EF853F9